MIQTGKGLHLSSWIKPANSGTHDEITKDIDAKKPLANAYVHKFQAVNHETGEILANCKYRIIRENGITDKNGFGKMVKGNKAEKISIRISFEAPAKYIESEEFTTKTTLQRLLDMDYSTQSLNIIKVDDQAATRLSIIKDIRKAGFTFKRTDDWGAKAMPSVPINNKDNWNYYGIAIHHNIGRGGSFSSDSIEKLREAEKTDFLHFKQRSYHYAIDGNGTIFENLNIRYRGAHVAQANTGLIGIVMLADLASRGSGYKHIVDHKHLGTDDIEDIIVDEVDFMSDTVSSNMFNATSILIKVLLDHFKITALGVPPRISITFSAS